MSPSLSPDVWVRQQRLEDRLDGHESLCAERYDAILKRLDRIEHAVYGAAGALILSLVTAFLLHAKF